jgi:hypothetical protein
VVCLLANQQIVWLLAKLCFVAPCCEPCSVSPLPKAPGRKTPPATKGPSITGASPRSGGGSRPPNDGGAGGGPSSSSMSSAGSRGKLPR